MTPTPYFFPLPFFLIPHPICRAVESGIKYPCAFIDITPELLNSKKTWWQTTFHHPYPSLAPPPFLRQETYKPFSDAMVHPSTQDPTNHVSDEVLLARIAAKDTQAFEILYDRHAKTVYSLILRIVQDPSVAEDLLQESFWQVWRKAEQFQESGPAGAWLCRIGRNKALDHLRRQKARPQKAEKGITGLEQMTGPANQEVEAQITQLWDREFLQKALSAIPHEQRQCLEMAYFEGKSQREIAATIGVPLGTVKTRIRIGLEKLERSLRAAGYGETDLP
ncbi:MAG: sigma-70 family RNA polymerase sigma factor [Caldilineae bacterium]|nr:MAG: sigma-70 family RNA polymerase sigma factor [Caldilineae bacterium]